jgi:adhesin transport system outer membrane protein
MRLIQFYTSIIRLKILFALLLVYVGYVNADIDMPPKIYGEESLLASDPRVQNLRQIVQQVMEQHLDLVQAEAGSRQAEEKLKEAESGRLPQTRLTGNVGPQNQQIQLTNRSAQYTQQLVQLGVSVPIYDSGLNAQIKQRDAGTLVANWQLTSVRQQLVLHTVEVYAELYRQATLTELARENLKNHRTYVSQVKEIAKVDIGRSAELPMAQSRVALAESVLISRLAKLEAARIDWTLHTNLPSPEISYETSNAKKLIELPMPKLPETVDLAVEEAIQNSPQLQKAMAELEVAKHGIDGAKSTYLPKFNAEANGRYGKDYSNILGQQSNWYVGVAMDWTLPINPSRGHSVSAAQEAMYAANSARDRLAQQIRASIETQWYQMLAGQSSLTTFIAYVSSAEQALQAYKEQFKIGRRSLLDVLNAENELFTARSNASSTEIDLLLASWRLVALHSSSRSDLGI